MEKTGVAFFRHYGKKYLFKVEPNQCPLGYENCYLCNNHIDDPQVCVHYSNLQVTEKTTYSVSCQATFECDYL